MREENLERVRSIYAAWERGDFSSVSWAHPDIEYVHADGPDAGVWKGLRAMADQFREFITTWQDWRVEAEEYRELDAQRVMVLFRFSAQGKGSGVEVGRMRTEGATIFHMRDGKVARLVQYFDRRAAFESVGLAEGG